MREIFEAVFVQLVGLYVIAYVVLLLCRLFEMFADYMAIKDKIVNGS